ncbi:uncharacterized protein LACBIDRAFT_328223 [Laccaria bicolor S238N-H82]|uniref:Predicted protein n=1 Tax=Laccaria bicolor (strain S238N-H82 / ATCC MYA-4686) TaxID=486041 RepID=B0DE48_LACBS|nr:uncharacterized protein LACBIDRAFT_328223 [Laccaria bicolor S238N-H82]EDR07325.1 predicted protein [Laccaria bicolor S238N-H82]|eukprot:XP_001882256.1 predicted protein [Laccaria bicolor S238N-H82]
MWSLEHLHNMKILLSRHHVAKITKAHDETRSLPNKQGPRRHCDDAAHINPGGPGGFKLPQTPVSGLNLQLESQNGNGWEKMAVNGLYGRLPTLSITANSSPNGNG